MTERDYYVERRDANTPVQREVYHDRASATGADAPADARRELSRERVAGPDGTYEARREQIVTPSRDDRRAAAALRVQQVIAFVVGTIVVLLAVRFVFLLLAANASSPFVQFIYGLTQPLVLPFLGIFGEPTMGASLVEWASLVAIFFYSLIGYGLHRLVDMTFKPVRSYR